MKKKTFVLNYKTSWREEMWQHDRMKCNDKTQRSKMTRQNEKDDEIKWSETIRQNKEDDETLHYKPWSISKAWSEKLHGLMEKANYEQNEDCDLFHALYAPLALKKIVQRSCNNRRCWKKKRSNCLNRWKVEN
jgi:hypothetical protein